MHQVSSNSILIVDDNTENLNVLKTYLNDAGYHVTIASSGATALERIPRINPMLILLDIKMPGMDGFEVCQQLKQNPDTNQIPIIFVTATHEADSIAHGFDIGGVDYLTKPISKQELLARVKTHLKIANINKYLERQVEEQNYELKASEERYRTAIEGTQDGLWDIDLVNHKHYFSKRFHTMLGYDKDELITNKTPLTNIVFPADIKKVTEDFKAYRTNKTSFFESTFRIKTKAGSYRWVISRGKAKYNYIGEAINITGFITDITHRKEAEDQLKETIKKYKETNHQLKKSIQQIEQINTDLEIAKTKAEENDRLKTAFLANLSHEVRTPLNGILGFNSLLKKNNLPKEVQERYISIVEKSGYQLVSLIDNLVEISKIEANQIKLQEENTNIDRLITEILSDYQSNAAEKNIKLSFTNQLTPPEFNVFLDTHKLAQIVKSLIDNAIKFTLSGEVSISCKLSDKQLIISVKDTGEGIPKNQQNKIFNRFTQINHLNTRVVEGMGLGLTISKAYIDIMQGTIQVESEPFVGSTFTITTPYTPSNTNLRTPAEPVIAKKERNDIKVLIAEDDPTSYQYLEQLLIMEHYKVMHAMNGLEAVKCFAENPDIQLILMDMKMPQMDGLSATREIRKTNKTIPIIAQTAYHTSKDKQKAIKAGCSDFIAKPITNTDLLKKIQQFTSKE